MITNTRHFTRNPLEICILCFCCIIFVYLLSVSKQITKRQDAIAHQYLTFAGYVTRLDLQQNPIVSPDYIVWEAEAPFLEENARLSTIISTSIDQLENGIVPEGAKEGTKPVPLGPNQRKFVEERLADAAKLSTELSNKHAPVIAEAKKKRNDLLDTMIKDRYASILDELNSLFELRGAFFFVYYPKSEDLYTDYLVSAGDRFQILNLIRTRRTMATNAHINLISIDDGVQMGIYVPANYNNPIILKIVRDNIPLIVLTLVVPCLVCSFFASSFLRAHRQKELAFRIKRATHLIQDFNEADTTSIKGKHKRYHDFKSHNPVEMAIYGASSQQAGLTTTGSLIGHEPIKGQDNDEQTNIDALLDAGNPMRSKRKGMPTDVALQNSNTTGQRSVLYDAAWVEKFLSPETTPIRKQLDRHSKIPARGMFLKILQELWTKKSFLYAPIYLAHIDADDLERANRLLGYTAGDTILFNMIAIIRNHIGKQGVIGRLSSDNLIFLYIGNRADFNVIIQSILVDINTMVFDGSSVYRPSASIGTTEILEQDNSIDDGQRRALAALYNAKNSGKNCARDM